LQISGFDHKKGTWNRPACDFVTISPDDVLGSGISVASGSTMRFAKVTYHGSREGALHGSFDEL